MCNYYETNYVIINDSGYQIIHRDQKLLDDNKGQQTIISARFNRNQIGDIETVDFKLFNVNANLGKSKYKIHFAVWCSKLSRIELHLSYHPNYKKSSYDCFSQLENEISLIKDSKLNICIRVTSNKTFSNQLVCDSGPIQSPDDKDGSIIIGT